MSNTPHDHVVRHVFAHPEHARGQLQHMLPDALGAHVDWETLEHVPGSFVDSTLSDRHADLLYRVRVGERPLLCYLLLEHQSGAP